MFPSNYKYEIINDTTFYILKCTKQMNYPVKVTCGLTCKTDSGIYGHKTCAYGVTVDEANTIKSEYDKYIGNKYIGHNIIVNVNQKYGGSIIQIPELSKTTHVTNNTIIKSVLSGPILEKYNENILDFTLTDIDPSAKVNKSINILCDDDKLEVKIDGWYCYLI